MDVARLVCISSKQCVTQVRIRRDIRVSQVRIAPLGCDLLAVGICDTEEALEVLRRVGPPANANKVDQLDQEPSLATGALVDRLC